MLVAHLSAASSVTRANAPRPALGSAALALTPLIQRDQTRHFWRSRRHWESPADPEYALFHRRRHQRVRAALKDALRRRSKWHVPVSFTSLFGARQASHWSKTFKRWPQLEEELRKHQKGQSITDDYELSPGEKRWKKHMQSVKHLAESDPYRAVFGRPFTPFWSPALWDSSSKASKTTNEAGVSGGPSSIIGSRKSSALSYAEASSFSYSSWQRPGQAPVIEASSTKWDSASNTATTFRFDPVSNRMVPESEIPKDGVDGLTADSIRASMGNSPAPEADSFSPTRQARIDSLTERFERQSKSVDQQIDQARQSLSASNDGHSNDAKSDGFSTHPKGLQTSFKDEKTALADDIANRVNIDEVEDGFSRKPIGMQNSFREEKTALVDDLVASAKAEEIDDGYSRSPKGLQSSFASEGTALAAEIRDQVKAQDVDDGYSKTPSGMQTSFTDEKVPLSSTLTEQLRPVEVDDGYSKAPSGMQTSFTNEKTPLSSTLSEHMRPVEIDDGYSKAPVGMQTSYTEEQQAIVDNSQLPLHQELASRHIAPELEDGYSKDPTGMQTSYTSEQEDCEGNPQTTLEREFDEKLIVKDIDDGYSKEPIGMQTSYVDEHKEHNDPERTALEHDLHERLSQDPNVDDGYSVKPMGMQTNYTAEQQDIAENKRVPFHEEISALQDPIHVDDGYSNQPIGLQRAFDLEQEDVSNRDRPSLAEEIELNMKLALEKSTSQVDEIADLAHQKGLDLEQELESARLTIKKLEEQLKLAMFNSKNIEQELKAERSSEAWKEDEADFPGGLQFLADQKQQVAEQEMLESEAQSQNATARAHDRAAFQSNLNGAVPGGKRPFHAAPAADRLVQAEGDMARDVAKYAHNDRWYKQMHTAAQPSIAFSNEQLVQEIVKICEDNGLLQPHEELQKIQKQILEKVQALETRMESKEAERASVEWADPPSYKILAYDADIDAIQTVTTTSRFSETENPISVAEAMSKVVEPARFVSHFARFQKDGYQSIHASEHVVVLRKMQGSAVAEGEDADAKPSPVNPVDGTMRQQTETATGNFASPTGFVNHDPLFPPDEQGRNTAGKSPYASVSTTGAAVADESQDGIYYRPRHVRRQEPVFSGRRNNDWERGRYRRHRHERRRAAWKRRVRFAFGVGVTSAALVYALGVGAELAKGDKQQR